MTFLELQNRAMDRLNLSTDDARTRIKNFINERVRALQTSCALGLVRRATISFDTNEDTTTYDLIDDESSVAIILPKTFRLPDNGRVLTSGSIDQFRVLDPARAHVGAPQQYAVDLQGASVCRVQFYPQPDGAYTVEIDGIAQGVELVDDTDVPAFPEDFHDAITFGVLADENGHFAREEKSNYYEKKFEKRASEARYFISRQIYLHRIQNGFSFDFSSNQWWWLYGSPRVAA